MDSDTDGSIIVENNNPTIDLNLVEKAVLALLKYEATRPKKEDNNLLLVDQSVAVWLIVTTFKFSDKPKAKPVSIPLKNPLYGPSTEICLITKDPQRTYKEWVTTHKVKCIRKVIGVSKLRKKYIPYEAKRNLCDSYDLFLADERVLPLLPKMLGKYFFEKKKQPVSVNISKETNFKKEILKACHCTYMHYSPGVCLSIKVGTTDMTPNQLLENLEMVIPIVIDKIPRKWKNIQSLQIKTPESISLPIYNCLPDLPIEIDPKDIKKENSENYGDENEINININDLDSEESDSDKDEVEDVLEDEKHNMEDEEDYNTDEDDTDELEEESEEEEDEEKLVKKRKISKDTAGVKFSAVVPKNNKNSQLNNSQLKSSSTSVITKKEEKGPLNQKDKKRGTNKKEKLNSVEVISDAKKNNMKRGGKANNAVKANISAESKKVNVKEGKEARNMTEAKIDNPKMSEKSDNSSKVLTATSNKKKRKKSPKIKDEKSATDVIINTKKEDEKDFSNEVSNFIAEQKKEMMGQKKIDHDKRNGNDEAAEAATNVGNKKAIEKKNVSKKNASENKKEVSNKTNVKSADNSEKKKVLEKKKDKKNDKGTNSEKNNVFENKKSANSANNKQASLKRKSEASGQSGPNKKSIAKKK